MQSVKKWRINKRKRFLFQRLLVEKTGCRKIAGAVHCTACERSAKRSGAGRKVDEWERSSEHIPENA